MPEVHYKFKSSLSFEIIKFSEQTITVGILKDLINQKQSIKTSGFDLKLKDTHGKIYTDDDDTIDLNSKIIVSRVPKISKAQINVTKKEKVVSNNMPDNITIDVKDLGAKAICSDNTLNVLSGNSESESLKVTEHVQEISPQLIPDILKCGLCNNLMKDSMQIQCCKKNYCHECITGYLFDPDISGSLECPDCKAFVSSKDANLTDNLKIRNMIYDLKNGKLDAETVLESQNNTAFPTEQDITTETENFNEIEIQSLTPESHSSAFDKQFANPLVTSEIIQAEVTSNERTNESTVYVIEQQMLPLESVTFNSVGPIETKCDVPIFSIESTDLNASCCEGNQIEQHYQGHSYSNSMTTENQFDKRVGIPVLNTSYHASDNKSNSNAKDSGELSINDMEFDPVLYMKFLKIVGENWPEELRKILSNNNDSIHISKEARKTSSSNKRLKEDDTYQEKHSSKKPRYDMENDDLKYKKSFNSMDRHSESRYYDTIDKKNSRLRSRSKEHYQKKQDTYLSRSRDYEARDREYYPNNCSTYHGSDGPNYQDDRHKYRQNYNSLHRIKSNTKYKRPMDR